MSTEDRLRAATRARTDLVTSIRALELPDELPVRARRPRFARRWGGWLIPLTAAVAVIAVAATLVAVRQSRTASQPVTSTAPATIPRYYVALDADGLGYTGTGALIVGDDRTGKAIATVKPPHGIRFLSVQGASDDRTFVVKGDSTTLGSSPDIAEFTWYLLRIAPGTARPYELTKLPVNSPVGVYYALSPDGRELAVESQSSISGSSISSRDVVTTLTLYSVPSGAELRTWTTHTNILSGSAASTLSWLSDSRHLAFSDIQASTPAGSLQLRMLDVTGSGTDLIAASRALLKVTLSGPANCWMMRITPDGGTIVCGTQYAFLSGAGSNAGCAQDGPGFTTYSVRTGKPVRVLYKYQGPCSNGLSYVLWTDASARYVIGATEINPSSADTHAGQLGVITGGHITLLKLPKSMSFTNYPDVAF
jgi:hypothetical protein